MKIKKVVILTAVGAVTVIGLGLVGVQAASASDVESRETFHASLAQKLGLSEEIVEGAFEELHEERRVEMQADRAETILSAIENGDITDRQAQILDSMEDIREEHMGTAVRDFNGERPEKGQLEDLMLEQLNGSGLEVTQEELDDLHKVMEDLGLGRREIGMHGGMGMGRSRSEK